MNKNKAKLVTGFLLAAESIMGMLAIITAIYAAFAWGSDEPFLYRASQIWMLENAVYVFTGCILLYGIFLRPKRRKLIQIFSSHRYSNNKLRVCLEIVAAVAVFIAGTLQVSWLYLVILGIYAAWKLFEYNIDYKEFQKHYEC